LEHSDYTDLTTHIQIQQFLAEFQAK